MLNNCGECVTLKSVHVNSYDVFKLYILVLHYQ